MLHVLEVKVPDSVIWESLKGRISDKWILQIRRTILRNEMDALLKEQSEGLLYGHQEREICDKIAILEKELEELRD